MNKQEGKILKELVKKLLILRDGNVCFKCKKCVPALQWSHLYPEGKYPRLKYEPLNVCLMCYGCHLHWWHINIIEAYEWFIKAFPLSRRNALKKMIKNYDSMEKNDFNERRVILEKKIKQLSNTHK